MPLLPAVLVPHRFSTVVVILLRWWASVALAVLVELELIFVALQLRVSAVKSFSWRVVVNGCYLWFA